MKIKCPQCGKATTFKNNPDRPFCSERCKLLDLGNWISEKYAVSNAGLEEEENDSSKSCEESPEE